MINHAKKFIKEYSLTKATLTPAHLEQIIKKQGCTIIRFDRNSNSNDVVELLKVLNLSHMIKSHNGFSYEDEDNGFVFIKGKLTENEQRDIYLHELGHIYLRHTRTAGNEILQEFQAEAFSICVKALLYINHIAKIAVMALLLIAIGITAIAINDRNKYQPAEQTETMTTQLPLQMPDISTMVYITKSGEKYHRPECMYIANKTNTTEISKSDAERLGYEPCKVCKP